jgi:hypothetical protein
METHIGGSKKKDFRFCLNATHIVSIPVILSEPHVRQVVMQRSGVLSVEKY